MLTAGGDYIVLMVFGDDPCYANSGWLYVFVFFFSFSHGT